MKKLALLLAATLSLNLSSCFNSNIDARTDEVQAEVKTEVKKELRGVWLSFYEISEICKGKTEEEYTESVKEIIRVIRESGFNTVFFQVRCFSDALYKSSVFPSSRYIAEKEGAEISFDPLKIFIELAAENNIAVHAWINPLRISYTTDISELSEDNPAKRLYDEDEDLSSLIICEKGIYYNPADAAARKVILSGVKEIIENYDVAGIQFDDYFYPECEDINDAIHYNSYKENNGQLTLQEWRKANVSSLISSVYNLIKTCKEDLIFGVSPSASFSKNEKICADVNLWCKEDGFVDYIMPQTYYGFENETMPFTETVNEWLGLEKSESVKLYFGLAAYKCGETDENAGSGKNEWREKTDILSRQYEYLKLSNDFSGVSLYSYSYCFGGNLNEQAKSEVKGLVGKFN